MNLRILNLPSWSSAALALMVAAVALVILVMGVERHADALGVGSDTMHFRGVSFLAPIPTASETIGNVPGVIGPMSAVSTGSGAGVFPATCADYAGTGPIVNEINLNGTLSPTAWIRYCTETAPGVNVVIHLLPVGGG